MSASSPPNPAPNPADTPYHETGAEDGVIALPQNVAAEAALLGALLIDNRLAEIIQGNLRPEHFFDPLHARIYEQTLKLIDRDMVANAVTMRPLFDAQQGAYLADLSQNSAALIAAGDFARQIYDLALLRELVRVGRDMATSALDTSDDIAPEDQIAQAEMALYKIAEQGDVASGAQDFNISAKLAIDMAGRALQSGGHLSGVTTGLHVLNDRLGGLHKSDLIILAGRPGMGKTALATNIAFSAAHRWMRDQEEDRDPEQGTGAGVAFFSLEMSADQLATRILSEQVGMSSENLRMGKIAREEFNRLAQVATQLQDLPLYIDDTPGLTIAALRTRARRLKRRKNIGLIVVDYLQLLRGTARNAGENRVQEISEISRGLKTLAKELNVPVLALSQLSRAVEQREDKRPHLSDLRESGSIEQDADMVLFIYREEYYHGMRKPEDGGPAFEAWINKAHEIEGLAEIIIAKQRHGATGTVAVAFHKATTKFSDRTDAAHLPERRG